MNTIAIDVALLVPNEIDDLCIDLNHEENAKAFSELNKIDNHPHITLTMGVIEEEKLEEAIKIVDEIISDFSPLRLSIISKQQETMPNGKSSDEFYVESTNEIVELHKRILASLAPILSFDPTIEMFFKDENEIIETVSTYWIEHYKEKLNHPEKFSPHISLKCENCSYSSFPVDFTTSKLVLAQLGNYCTIRPLLHEFDLTK